MTLHSASASAHGDRRRWRRRLTAFALIMPMAFVGALTLGEAAAFAHTTSIAGTAVCDTTHGTYTVHWVGVTASVPADRVAAVTTTAHSPAESSVPATVVTNLAPNASYFFDQTGIPGTASSVSVSVHIDWTGGGTFSTNASGSLTGLTPCTSPPPVTQQLSGHIYLCPTSGATTTEQPGGTLAATGAQNVPSQGNPLGSTEVLAGSYTMTATNPTGYTLVACGSGATVNPAGTSATQPVTVPAGGTGVGIFYVRRIPVQTSTGGGGIVLSPPAATPEVPTLGGGTIELPRTGASTQAWLVLALVLLTTGVAVTLLGDVRAPVRPRRERSSHRVPWRLGANADLVFDAGQRPSRS